MDTAALVNSSLKADTAIINKISNDIHPIQQFLARHPGTGNYEIAQNIPDMSSCDVYNWLLKAVENGELDYQLGKYYLAE